MDGSLASAQGLASDDFGALCFAAHLSDDPLAERADIV